MPSTTNSPTNLDSRAADTAPCRPLNIASYLPTMANIVPNQPAVIVTSGKRGGRFQYEQLSFAELEALTNKYANGLRQAGIERGTRTLVMVRAGADFIALAFALFKLGAVPVLIDPGMGVKPFLSCVRQVKPQAMIGIPLAHALRVACPGTFSSVSRRVTVGRRWFWSGPTLARLAESASGSFEMASTAADETAAILFTSGSTGPAKGVVYQHGMFATQVEWISSLYGIEPGEIDLPAFPLFGLFSIAMGMTCVIADMDPSHPARVDPANIVRTIRDHNVTSTFGSPAIWDHVGTYCLKNRIALPTLRRVMMAGAPCPLPVLANMRQVLPLEAEIHTPYGATEALPVASITAAEVLDQCSAKTRNGAGTCVGRPVPGIEVRIIRISDEPIARWSDDLVVPRGQVGEVAVRGPVVTREYFDLPDATAAAKIPHGDTIWHRMGDLGYFDETGRLWFCGRKAHRVVTEQETMYSVCCEGIFNAVPDIKRSALVGIGQRGHQRPVIIIEPVRTGCRPCDEVFRAQLLDLAQAHLQTRSIRDVLYHSSFPVDVRHNVKINREQLAAWAARRLP